MPAGLHGDIKIGVDLKTKSASKAVESFRKKIRDSFGGQDAKGLEQTIKNTEKTIKSLEREIEKTKSKIQDLMQGETEPKSIKAMEKELQQTEKEIDKVAKQLDALAEERKSAEASRPTGLSNKDWAKMPEGKRSNEITGKMIPLNQELGKLVSKSDELKAKLNQLKSNPQLTEEGRKYNRELDEATTELENQKKKLQELKNEQNAFNKSVGGSDVQFKGMQKNLRRVRELIKSAFVFSVITKGATLLRESIGKIVKQNTALQSSLNQIKGNLLTAFAPIWQTILPWLQTFFNWLVKITQSLAQFISLLSGKSVKASAEAAKALYKQATATNEVGSATQNAENSLLSFDELNTISTPKESGTADTETAAPDFGPMLDESQQLSDFWSSLALTIKDVFFEWGNDLTTENIVEKIITAAGMVTGAVIGWGLGGPQGALIGLTIGAGLSLLLSSLIFNHDGTLSSGEILKSIIIILGAVAGGIVGFTAGGPLGTAVGIAIGAGLAFSIANIELGSNGNLTTGSFVKLIQNLLLPIGGGVIGFAFGGATGALLGISVGCLLNLAIQQSELSDTDGKLKVLHGVILTSALIISAMVSKGLSKLPKLGKGIQGLTPKIIGVVGGFALLTAGVKDFIEKGPTLQNTIMIIGGAIALAISVATMGLGPLVGVVVGLVAAIGAFFAAIALEETAIMSVKEAQENLTAAKERAKDAENEYINAVDNSEAALKRLEEAEKAAGISGEELFGKVQSGTLDYKDMNDIQKELYKAYLDNEQKQKDLKTATEELTTAKKEETLASFENELAVAKEKGSYDEYKKSVIDAYKQGTLSADEARELIGKSMSEMSDAAQKTFMEDLPDSIKEGLDPHQYETAGTKMAKWFSGIWTSLVDAFKNAWDGALTWWKNLFGGESESKGADKSSTKKSTKTSTARTTAALQSVSVSVPALAQGTVLPPNKPFAAIVGDQKHGTNIEAPLDTIVEAMLIALSKGDFGNNGDININFTGNLSQLARVLNPVIEREKKRGSTKLVKGGAH